MIQDSEMATAKFQGSSDIQGEDATSTRDFSEEGHYVVTAQRAGVVLLAERCSFLGPNSIDVAIVKSSRLEIRQVTSNDSIAAVASTKNDNNSTLSGAVNNTRSTTLPLILDLPIRGRICTLLSFRHPGIPTDLLFFTTDNHRYAVISYSPTSPSNTITHASGSLYDGILRSNECGPIAILDPKNKCIALHLYDGFIQILPIQEGYSYPQASNSSSKSNTSSSSSSYPKKKGRHSSSSLLGKPFNARIDERTVLNMCFLAPPSDDEKDPYDDESDMDRKLPARGSTTHTSNRKHNNAYTPQIVILHQDSKGNQHLVSHFVDTKRGELILYSSAAAAAAGMATAAASASASGKAAPSTSAMSFAASAAQKLMKKSRVDGGSGRIIPVQSKNAAHWGGILVLGQRHITFHSSALSCTRTIPVEHTLFLASCCISEGRYLIGDDRGMLYLLVLEISAEGTFIAFQMEGLGVISVPSALVYLENEAVYVGSQFGDSQLITSLMPELVIAEEYMNLGPIVDFDLVPTTAAGSSSLPPFSMLEESKTQTPTDKTQTQSLIVTCSGAGKEGSIRLIRNGIGVEEQASVDLPGIKGMWNLRANFRDKFDTYLVQSYLGETRILGFGTGDDGEEEGELEEVVFPGFEADVSTLYCGNVEFGIVQVTERGVRLLETDMWSMQYLWKPQDGFITVAGGNQMGQIVVALRGGVLVSLKVDQDGIIETGRRKMDQEVSCIDLHPLDIKNDDPHAMDLGNDFQPSKIVAVGLWNDVTVRLLALQTVNLEELLKINLGGDTQARSLIMAILGNEPLLLIGLGDGNLITYCLSIHDDGMSSKITTHSRKKISLGTQSISLTAFQNATSSKSSRSSHWGCTCVFATGDRPTVIYTSGTVNTSRSKYSGDKLCFSNVNLSTYDRMIVNYVTPFQLPRSSQSECCLCLADEASLCIGIIDDIQKLHVQTMKLHGGVPRRIAYHAVGKCFAVGCCADADGMANFIRFLDSCTLEEFNRIDLDPYETVLSLLSTPLLNTSQFADPPKQYVVVGTAYGYPDEDEPTRGRVLVYEVKMPNNSDVSGLEESSSFLSRSIKQVTEYTVKGGVYAIAPFGDGALLGTVNSKCHLFRFRDIEGIAELKPEPGASHHGHILSLALKTLPSSPDIAIVGDLLRSISVLQYSSQHHILEEVARDYNSNWMTALEMLSDEVYLGAENWNNLFVLKRNTHGPSDEVRCRLDTQGEFHLGEMVNKFMRGRLIMPLEGQSSSSNGVVGTGGGAISQNKETIEIGSETLYATVDGSIGSILGLNAKVYAFFNVLERAIAHIIPGVGNLNNDEFRSFEAERRVHPSHGIIDGDLVESFLDLNRTEMEKIVKFMNADGGWVRYDNPGGEENSGMEIMATGQEVQIGGNEGRILTIEEVVTRVEEISRLH